MKTAIALFAAALSVAALSTNASAQKLMPVAGMKAPKLVANVSGTSGPGGTSYMTGGGGKTSANVSGTSGPGGSTFMTGNHSSISVAPIPSPNPRVKVPAPDKHDAAQTQAPFQTKAFPTEEWMPSTKPAANTSFGSRSGGGFKLVSQSADITVEKAMNSGSSDENIAAAACASPVNDVIAVVIIIAVDADNCPKSPAANAALAGEQDQAGIAIPAFVAGEGEPQAATADDYALIASLIGIAVTGGEADEAGETEPAAATAIEYGLIATLTSNDPDVNDTVYWEPEFE